MLLFFQFNLQLSSLSKETVYATRLLTEPYMTCPLDPPQPHLKRFTPLPPAHPRSFLFTTLRRFPSSPQGRLNLIFWVHFKGQPLALRQWLPVHSLTTQFIFSF